uniref:G-protein coupled receptors family 1 profile domain-containing protein n=1 Tax=Haplochromis burtoni TaxID=8153 RepID=A0A3Q2VPH2_HAPBU
LSSSPHPQLVYGNISIIQNDITLFTYKVTFQSQVWVIYFLFCMVVHMSGVKDFLTQIIFSFFVYPSGLMASVSFMVCVSMERYLVVAHPMWYQDRRTIKVTVVVCVSVWIISIFVGLLHRNFLGAFLVLPFPLLFFFLIKTIKAVSATSVPTDEKQRIVAVLVLVVLIYILVFVPRTILEILYLTDVDEQTFYFVYDTTCSLVQLNPLIDLIMYFFINKWVLDKLFSCLMQGFEGRSKTDDEQKGRD